MTDIPTSKACTRCGQTKPIDQYGPSKMGKHGLRADCKPCRRDYYRDYQFERNLMRRYGITLQEYNQMRLEQNYSCAICFRHETEFERGLAVDHDHGTGKVRGLLCISCNRGLGYLGDDLDRLRMAMKYIEASQGSELGEYIGSLFRAAKRYGKAGER